METDTSYNGWTNYETWLVKLWIDNASETQQYWDDMAQSYIERPMESEVLTPTEATLYSMEMALKDWHHDNVPITEGINADLLTAALGRVNWQEIAKSVLDSLPERK